jgi:hypothetical protein
MYEDDDECGPRPKRRWTQLIGSAKGSDLWCRCLDQGVDRLGGSVGAGAVVGAMIAVMFAIVDDSTPDLATLLNEAMTHLETGLQL